ncbi:hypothetical protein KAI46_16510 [bacterium]|nr:hypothetical protein [bacterium]
MKNYFEIALNLISPLTGGQGGIEHGIVHFVVAGMLWFSLLLIAWFRQRHRRQTHEKLLLLGFGLGFAREFFMAAMVFVQACGIIDADSLHVFFPPLEHAVFNIAIVVIASGYMQYLLRTDILPKRYLKIGIGLILFCYIVTFSWWGQYISAHPESKFGQTWCDWLFRTNASILLAFPIIILVGKTRGWVRNAISVALFLFFLNEALKIPDMMLGEVYEGVFAPLRHGLYMFGIPILGYVYIRQLYEERELALSDLQTAHDKLEGKVKERTAELKKKIEEVKVLSGFLPICASCKKIRDDSGFWNQIESYISTHSEAEFTHGICPECTKKLYPEFCGDKT